MRQTTKKATSKGVRSAERRGASKAQKKVTSGNEVRRKKIKQEGLDGHTVLSVRITNAEFLEFADQVETLGLTNNRALRIAARRIGGFLEIDPESQVALKDIARQLTGIARNINQMAKIANTVKSVDHTDFLQERQKLGLELARASDLSQQLLNIGRRRNDGAARLKEAVADVE